MKSQILIALLYCAIIAVITLVTLEYKERLTDFKNVQNKLSKELDTTKHELAALLKRQEALKRSLDEANNKLSSTDEEKEALSSELETSQEALASATEELVEILRPFNDDVLSSALRANVSHDEVLVTGGYQTADGLYQYAFVEPFTHIDDLGNEVIHLRTKQFSITADIIETFGLETLITNAGNTLQHGEIWNTNELEIIEKALTQFDGVKIIDAPDLLVSSGKRGSIRTGDYQISTRSSFLENNSGYDIEFRIEQARMPESMEEEE